MFAYDEGWSRRINEAIDSGLTAEAAIERVRQRMQQRMRQIDDALLAGSDARPRRSRRTGCCGSSPASSAPPPRPACRADAILIARNLGPAELLEYDRRKLKGVILEEGSLTAHVTIVARAMGVPMVGRIAQRPPVDRGGRPRPARRRRGERARPPEPGDRGGVRHQVRGHPEAPRRICRGQGQAGGDQGRRPHRGDGQCRPARRRRRARPPPAPTASACSAPNSSSSSRRRCRAARASSGSTARCSTPPATSRSSSAPSTSAATRACPISTPARSMRRIRRWAGARFASRSTATA